MNNPLYRFSTKVRQIDMSLRPYFAACAPDVIPEWFQPPPRVKLPESNLDLKWCDNCKYDIGNCTRDADCDTILQHRRDREAAIEQNQQHRYFQWRWAYADGMIGEMNRKD